MTVSKELRPVETDGGAERPAGARRLATAIAAGVSMARRLSAAMRAAGATPRHVRALAAHGVRLLQRQAPIVRRLPPAVSIGTTPAPRGAETEPAPADPHAFEADEIARSGLFEPAFYCKQLLRRGLLVDSPSTASSDGLLRHFLERGGAAGIAPHPLFDAAEYLRANPDVAAAGMNPLTHYLRHGFREGRRPGRLFNPAFYLDANPDLPRGLNPLQHFVEHGIAEQRRAWTSADADTLLISPRADAGLGGCLDSPQRPSGDANASWEGLTFGLYAHSEGSYRFHELRDLLAHGLRQCGITPVLLDERSEPLPNLAAHLVIAPTSSSSSATARSCAIPFRLETRCC